MIIKKKKTFKTATIHKIALLERLTYLIPLYMLLKFIIRDHSLIIEALKEYPTISMFFGIIVFLIIFVFLSSITPFAVVRLILFFYKKRIIKNSTFITVKDFDYYREKLDGLSPATISLLTNLEIERKKDIAASILQYENLGIIKIDENGHYQKTEKYNECNRIQKSDQFLIDQLINGNLNENKYSQWKKLAINEAKNYGYLMDRFGFKEENKILGCLIPFLLFVLWILWLFSFDARSNTLYQLLNTVPDNASLSYQIQFIYQNPSIIPPTAEMLALFTYTIILFFSPISALLSALASSKHIRTYKRTEYGNEMAECIFGMKNFIHDFSNLSEADRQQVVLWDDYLVYAVVLEENEKIVTEIINMRKKSLETNQKYQNL